MKFLNALFLGFLRLSLRAVFVKMAWQAINLALFLLFGLPRSLCSLAMTDKENALCHLARTDIFTQIAFKNLKIQHKGVKMTHFSGGAQALYHAFGEQISKEMK